MTTTCSHVHGFDSNGGGNVTRERAFAKPRTLPVLIKRLKKAMCGNACYVSVTVSLESE